MRWRAAGRTARWSCGTGGAWRCRRRGRAPGARACRCCCGRRCGRSRAAWPTRPARWRCDTCTEVRMRSSPTGRTSSATCAPAGAQRVYVAPQAVDNAFWVAPSESRPPIPWPARTGVRFLFAGRQAREKGLGVLIEAWSASGLQDPSAALVLVGAGSTPPWVPAGGAVVCLALLSTQTELRDFYAAAGRFGVAMIPTRTFCEPWGLVINEAMDRGLQVIATDAVGAAAGGLVRDGRNGADRAGRKTQSHWPPHS